MKFHPAVVVSVAVASLLGCGGTAIAVRDAPSVGGAEGWDERHTIPTSPQYARAIANSTRSPGGEPGPLHWTQHTDYTLRARLLPDEAVLHGSGRIVYHNESPDDLSSLRLELSLNIHAAGVVRNREVPPAEAMNLSRVVVDGNELAEGGNSGARYIVSGTNLVIVPPEAVPAGGQAVLDLAWSFDVPDVGAAGRMGHVEDELFFLAYWYPTMSVYDDVEGWHTDPFLGSAEFYHGFGDFDVTVELPREWLVHATGAHVNERDIFKPDVAERLATARESDEPVRIIDVADLDGGATRAADDGFLEWRFRAERVSDFSFSATRQSIWDAARTPVGDRDGDGTTEYAMVNAVYRTDAPLWNNVVGYGQHALRFLSNFTGFPYPWPHMTAVEGTPIESGGMEYPMMTLIGNYNYLGDSALYAVVAHETAHQWVPMITGTNERRYGWMDEGLTTFAENEAKHSRDPAALHRLAELRYYLSVARRGLESDIMTWSDYHHSASAQATAVYFKPSSVLEALRAVLGEATFLMGLRTFLSEWAYRHPYPEDFFATFERVSGRDLDWFWRAWFYETWQLDQAIEDVVTTNGAVMVTVRNLGLAPMPVDLVIELADRSTFRRRFEAEDLWTKDRKSAQLRIPVDGQVIRVELDPDMHFPDIERSNNVWWLDVTSESLQPNVGR